MRALSSAASITVHVALGAALLLGTTRAVQLRQPIAVSGPIIYIPESSTRDEGGEIEARMPVIPDHHPLPPLPDLGGVPQTGANPGPPIVLSWPPHGGNGQPDRWAAAVGTAGPEVLTGPLPTYPELLRRAGIEGQVVLEVVVDSTGRVQPSSIAVIAATHPGFVEPARQALMSTLFRPARVGARAVPMLVRVPFVFAVRGTGRAR